MPDTPTALEPGGVNPIGRMLGLLGDEWSLLILQQSLTGAVRYRDFVARLPISNSVLTNRLGTLTESGLLERHPVGGTGRTEYLPTRRAKSLWPVLLCIWEWERTWVTGHTGPLPAMRHQRCGHRFAPVLRCRACRGTVISGDVRIIAGPSGDWARSAPQSSTRRRSNAPGPARHAGLFPETMAVFGNRWSAALLVAAFLGTTRFTDFATQLGIPPNLLTERLQTFCSIGVLTCSPTEPHAADRAPYLLTEKGRALFGVLVCAHQWAHAWFRAPEGPALTLTHDGCGNPFDAELACGWCGERLRGALVDVIADAAADVADAAADVAAVSPRAATGIP
jgi:DNA-binding HxlR family transcriptional regulator